PRADAVVRVDVRVLHRGGRLAAAGRRRLEARPRDRHGGGVGAALQLFPLGVELTDVDGERPAAEQHAAAQHDRHQDGHAAPVPAQPTHGMTPFPASVYEPAMPPPNSGASAASGVTKLNRVVTVTVAFAV